MPRQPIATDRAPAAIGPYSQAVRSGGTVFLSGQIPLDPATGELVQGDFRAALKLDVDNKPGVLAQVAAAVAESDSNIDSVEYRERDLKVSVMEFGIEVRNRTHLADVIRRVRRLGVVHGVERI